MIIEVTYEGSFDREDSSFSTKNFPVEIANNKQVYTWKVYADIYLEYFQ